MAEQQTTMKSHPMSMCSKTLLSTSRPPSAKLDPILEVMLTIALRRPEPSCSQSQLRRKTMLQSISPSDLPTRRRRETFLEELSQTLMILMAVWTRAPRNVKKLLSEAQPLTKWWPNSTAWTSIS